jgi:hypothetical protein
MSDLSLSQRVIAEFQASSVIDPYAAADRFFLL